MKSIVLLLLPICAFFAASVWASRPDAESQQLLRESLRQLRAAGRGLQQDRSAFSSASGGQTASASATAGPGGASTQQSATGANSQVLGVSQVGAKVDTCQRGPANSAACETLTTTDRSSGCTDIAPSAEFTCPEQVAFGKCDADFIFLGAYCLKSCKRCDGDCYDTAPSGGSCVTSECNSTTISAGPYCLKTCGRCYVPA